MHACMYVYMYAWMHGCMDVCIYVSISIYPSIYPSIYAFVLLRSYHIMCHHFYGLMREWGQTAFAKWLINTHWNDFTAHQEDLCQVSSPFMHQLESLHAHTQTHAHAHTNTHTHAHAHAHAHAHTHTQVPFSLTVSASFIFITLMLNEASGMMNASLVALFRFSVCWPLVT
jgi:ABC-type nickel/cobalt efflux system permease component RcnA